jgi:hypothetical protein
MAQSASASAYETAETTQLRWSARRRTAVILTMATASWVVPAGLIYGLARIFL